MAIRSFCSFSHLRPEAFHIALKTHKTQHTQPTGWKKRRTNNHLLGLAPRARKEIFLTHLRSFLCICGLSWACIRAKFPHSHQGRWLIFTVSTDPCSSLSSCLPLFWLAALSCSQPSSVYCPYGLVGDLTCNPFAWVSRQNKQRNLLNVTTPHWIVYRK